MAPCEEVEARVAESCHLLVTNLHEVERPRPVDPAASAVYRAHARVDPVTGIAEEAVHGVEVRRRAADRAS